jgi:hypothetical protein
MAKAPQYLVFDGGTDLDGGTSLPRRPSTDDLGGDTKLDESPEPPDDITMPTAAGHNQIVKVTAAVAKTAASCKLEIDFSGSTPFVAAAAGMGSTIIPSTFGIPTDNGVGDTSVTWPANTFPPFTISPNGLTLYSSSTQVVAGHVQKITNGIRVRTFVNGAAADVPWSINLN